MAEGNEPGVPNEEVKAGGEQCPDDDVVGERSNGEGAELAVGIERQVKNRRGPAWDDAALALRAWAKPLTPSPA